MNKNYRIEDKRNVTLNGFKATLFTVYHRESHPLLECDFVCQGTFAGLGHDLSDEECWRRSRKHRTTDQKPATNKGPTGPFSFGGNKL